MKRIFLLVLIILCTNCAHALQMVKIEYEVPIEYRFLSEEEISAKAEGFYNDYMQTKNEESLKKMLCAYSLLTKINEDNPLYFVRTAIAYDKLKNDRYAKSYFGRSVCIEYHYPYTYSALGDFWYERLHYRRALKNYLIAHDYGLNYSYENLCNIGNCYEKLGDYSSAIDFFKKALAIQESEELMQKIQFLEEKLKQNSVYNEKRNVWSK